jgi:hypothetical protein
MGLPGGLDGTAYSPIRATPVLLIMRQMLQLKNPVTQEIKNSGSQGKGQKYGVIRDAD